MRRMGYGTSLLLFVTLLAGYPHPAYSAELMPEVTSEIRHGVSMPLREIAGIISEAQQTEQAPGLALGRVPITPGAASADPVVQRKAIAPFGGVIGMSFNGVGVGLGDFVPQYYPPDTTGAAGATQYVEWVNTSFAVFNKATGKVLLGPLPGNSLFYGFGGPCEFNNDGDPVVEYDKAAQRWVLSQFAIYGQGGFRECIAVSKTSDATGQYNLYAFRAGTNLLEFADYPRMGVWPNGYYFSFNVFDLSTNQFLVGRACAFDRIAMLNGRGANEICFSASNTGGMVPSDLDGQTPPPAGSPNYFVKLGVNALNIYSFYANFTNLFNSSFTGPVTVPVAPFLTPCVDNAPIGDAAVAGVKQPGCVPQKNSHVKLDALGDRLMYRGAYRNFGDHESLILLHTVAPRRSGNQPVGAALRWYELRNLSTGPTLYQQGTYAPNQQWRWMGSAGTDAAGDIAIGYSVSGPGIVPGIRITGRRPTDPLGKLEDEQDVIKGNAPQLGKIADLAYRWGDYTPMSVDPNDDCTFWYANEYITKRQPAPYWSTRIVSFKFPECTAP
jgi:hypothetical protein